MKTTAVSSSPKALMPPDFIIDRYRRKHDFDPKSLGVAPKELCKRYEKVRVTMWITFELALFCAVAVGLVIYTSRLSSWKIILLSMIPLLFLIEAIYMRKLCLQPLKIQRDAYTYGFGEFQGRYRRFLETLGLSEKEINILTDEEVSSLCENLLQESAQEAIQATREPKKRAKLTIKLFESHEIISDMGYGKDEAQTYLDKAGKSIV